MTYNKIFIYIILYSQVLLSESIDKQKILDIIKAAKENKSISVSSKSNESIVIYKKRKAVHKLDKEKVFVSLPAIPPSSMVLRRKYIDKQKDKKPRFTILNQKKNNKLKTTATPIKYY